MAQERANEFVWVDQSGSNVHETLQQNRRKIRQQARKHAISQLKNDRLQSIDVRLVENPGAVEQSHPKRRAPKCKSRKNDNYEGKSACNTQTVNYEKEHLLPQPAPQPPLSAKGYDLVRAVHGFDLSWLSALAMNHPGRTPADSNPSTPPLNRTAAVEWLNFRASTYVDMIPAYYNESRLLRSVIDCTLAKAEHTLSPTTRSGSNVLITYGAALQNMQESLKEKIVMQRPETLAAMQLLQIYELLEVGAPETWLSHTAGIRKMIKLRGPKNFITELDKSLLSTQIQYIYHHAFMNNEDCFLEEAQWQMFLHSIASPRKPGRHPLFLAMWATIVSVPRLFRQTTEYLQKADSGLDREDILFQLRKLRARLCQWRLDFAKGDCDKIFNRPFYNSLLSDGIANITVISRLIISMKPSAEDAYALELETQDLAVLMLRLRIERIVPAGYFVGLITKATKDDWLDVASGMRDKVNEVRDVIDLRIFQKWCAMMGRGGIYGSWPDQKGR